VDVDPAQASAVQAMLVNQMQQLGLIGHTGLGQCSHESQDLAPVSKLATGQLPDHKGMTDNLAGLEHRRQARRATPQVLHPDDVSTRTFKLPNVGAESAAVPSLSRQVSPGVERSPKQSAPGVPAAAKPSSR
jgi:hypothetical protein